MVPARMKAAVYKGDRTVEVEDYPIPEVGPDDVLLEVSHCGVCGSDIHFVLEGWGRPNSVDGHEYSGTVVAVGDQRDELGGRRLRRSAGRAVRCGECEYCRAGRPSLCVRPRPPWARAATGRARSPTTCASRQGELLRLPDGVSLRDAALTEPLAVALHGISQAKVQPGERVLVTGGGPIGTLTIAGARPPRHHRRRRVSEPTPRAPGARASASARRSRRARCAAHPTVTELDRRRAVPGRARVLGPRGRDGAVPRTARSAPGGSCSSVPGSSRPASTRTGSC